MAGEGLESRTRLPSLTSLRWIAATLVFLSHAQGHLVGEVTWFSRISVQGLSGVSFFFILSGFVLAWSHQAGTTAATFYRRRLARIYPAYVVVALISVPIIVALGEVHGLTHVIEALLPLSLLQAWVPHYRIAYSGNGVSWSLSCEAFFYAIFPALIVAVTRWTRRFTAAMLAVSLVVPLLLAIVLRTSGDIDMRFLLMYTNPLSRVAEFVIGVILGVALRSGVRIPWLRLGPVVALAVASYLAAGWVPLSFRAVSVTVVPFSLLIVAAAQADLLGETPAVLRSRVMVTLGQWSFAFYLVHQMVLRVLAKLDTTNFWQAAALGAGAYIVCIALSGALFTRVEQPMERILRSARSSPPREREVTA